MPILIQLAFLVAVLVIYVLRRTVTETIDDERTNVITQHAAVATLSVFWVVFFVLSLGSVVWEFSRPLGILPPRPPGAVPPAGPHFGNLGLVPARPARPDDHPLRRLPDLLRPEVRGVGVG